jgi:hypothetical protein
LVTTHVPFGFPLLYRTEVSLSLARRIVDGLLPADCTLISQRDIARCFAQHAGDLREVLFSLYDLYERRRA